MLHSKKYMKHMESLHMLLKTNSNLCFKEELMPQPEKLHVEQKEKDKDKEWE